MIVNLKCIFKKGNNNNVKLTIINTSFFKIKLNSVYISIKKYIYHLTFLFLK